VKNILKGDIPQLTLSPTKKERIGVYYDHAINSAWPCYYYYSQRLQSFSVVRKFPQESPVGLSSRFIFGVIALKNVGKVKKIPLTLGSFGSTIITNESR